VVEKLSKNQGPTRNLSRSVGVIIDCDELTISIFPPPREHGKAHCHVRSKKSRKTKGKSSEVFPELKIFLDGSDVIVITEGFSQKDMNIIGDLIFNEPNEGDISNDEYLLAVWQELHYA